jgi:hypothetical protein
VSNAVQYVGDVDEATAKFRADSPGAFRFAFAPFKGKKVKLTIEEWKATRTNQQNRAWFGIVVKLFMQHQGERDKEYMHRVILEHIGHYDLVETLGKTEKRLKRTSKLSTREFSELYEAAQQLGAEYGIMIPDPESAQARAMVEHE